MEFFFLMYVSAPVSEFLHYFINKHKNSMKIINKSMFEILFLDLSVLCYRQSDSKLFKKIFMNYSVVVCKINRFYLTP